MKNSDQKYDDLINRIKTVRPTLSDPQGLSAEIMSVIGELPDRTKPNRALKIVALGSSVAAILLFGVFLSEYSIPQTTPYTKQINTSNNTFLPSIDINSDRGKENLYDTLNDIVREKREQREAREIFYETIINRHQPF